MSSPRSGALNFMALSKKHWCFVIIFLLAIWVAAHLPGIFYGTDLVPLHMSYIGDEQSPVNGALHILRDKSLFALRDLPTVYYGPLFSVVALPAVIADFSVKYITGVVSGADDYRDFILWDWGGIIIWSRLLALIAGLFGIIGFYKLLSRPFANPSLGRLAPFVGSSLLALNFYYFEYSHFFKHWIFILTFLVWELYAIARILEKDENTSRFWFLAWTMTVLSFGVSYLGALFQIVWLPVLWHFVKARYRPSLMRFLAYATGSLFSFAAIVAWHPRAFFRILGITGGDIADADISSFTNEAAVSGLSYGYYASMLFVNHISLIALITVLCEYLWYKNKFPRHILISGIALSLLAYSLVFGLFGHHESRYILPLIFFITFLAGVIIGHFLSFEEKNRLVLVSSITLVLFTVIFHVAHIGRFMFITMQGPPERAAIEKIVSLEKNDEVSKTLFVKDYLFGYVHTKDAYRDYAEKFNKSGFNLYKAILNTVPPQSISPIRVYYTRTTEPLPKGAWRTYKRIGYHYDPRFAGLLEPDFMETRLVNLWFYKDFSDKYSFLKQ